MKSENIYDKFDYIQLKDKYEIMKVYYLFKEIGYDIFPMDSVIKVVEGENFKDNYLIRDNDGWRIQSHYIGLGNTVDDLYKHVQFYINMKKKKKLSGDEIMEIDKKINVLDEKFKHFLVYLSDSYYGEDDITKVSEKFDDIINSSSELYEEDFTDFLKNTNFNEKFDKYLSNKIKVSREFTIDNIEE